MTDPSVLVLPGLYNSGAEHWQSRWEATHPELKRVLQDEWAAPRLADWVARLDAVVRRAVTPVVLIAHSSSCALVAHWASAHDASPIRGALLVAPSDPEAPSYPQGPTGFAPMPLRRLPFPSTLVASSDDVYVTLARARDFASAWGSRLVEIGAVGHINGQSGLGDWPQGWALVEGLMRDRQGAPA